MCEAVRKWTWCVWEAKREDYQRDLLNIWTYDCDKVDISMEEWREWMDGLGFRGGIKGLGESTLLWCDLYSQARLGQLEEISSSARPE